MTEPGYVQTIADRLYPQQWDTARRAAFVAGVEWQRAQVEASGTPAEIERRRRDAVREAFPRG